MPKEKATRKSKKADAGKKKKGKQIPSLKLNGPLPYTDCMFLDPNAPKRGLSAYMFFANEQRENVREENPGISFGTRDSPTSQASDYC